MLCGALAPTVTAGGLREGDEFWVVSTRSISSTAQCADLHNPRFRIHQYAPSLGFQPQTRDQLIDLLSSDATKHSVIYAHGNRFDCAEAVQRGWFVYHKIACYRQAERPLRFIVWSWPSDRVDGVLKDVKIKAERTDSQGLYLAWLLREAAPAPTPLTVLGYSFGGRVVTGALHALAGGCLAGRQLPGKHVQGLHVNVGLVAAAVNQDWLYPGRYHGRATLNMASMTLMYNPRDSILKRYWILEPGLSARALGVTGPVRVGPRADGSRLPVTARNCSNTVGTHHDELDYFSQLCRAGKIFARLIESQGLESQLEACQELP